MSGACPQLGKADGGLVVDSGDLYPHRANRVLPFAHPAEARRADEHLRSGQWVDEEALSTQRGKETRRGGVMCIRLVEMGDQDARVDSNRHSGQSARNSSR